MLGTVDYVTTIRADAIETAFARREIIARVARGTEAEKTFLRASRGEATVTVSAQIREQMLRELMTTDCLIDMVAAILDDTTAGTAGDEPRMVFCNERCSWPRAPVLFSRLPRQAEDNN